MEVYGTYTNGGSYTARDLIDDWLTNSMFDDATLHDDTYTHVGAACTCDQTATVYCQLIFANTPIG